MNDFYCQWKLRWLVETRMNVNLTYVYWNIYAHIFPLHVLENRIMSYLGIHASIYNFRR